MFWQIILFMVLASIFIAMFLIGVAILKVKAEEAQPEIHPSSDRAARADRASRLGSRWDMTSEERRDSQRNDVFNSVTSDIQQIINPTLRGIDPPPPSQVNRNGDSLWSNYVLSQPYHSSTNPLTDTPTPQPKPEPEVPQQPEEKYHSSNAIDDLDLL